MKYYSVFCNLLYRHQYVVAMLKKLLSLVIIACLISPAFAQGPPPGGGSGGGFPGGQGSRRSESRPVTPTDGNFDAPKGNGNSKISGILLDSANNNPVEFAAIALVDSKTNKPVDGTTTDEKGKFSISKISEGEYKLLISFIGYKNREMTHLVIGKKDNVDLGKVTLAPDVVQLKEVNVVGMAQMIEEKVDRLVFNAEKDLTSKGGDATDVMRKVPMLSVDLDGNLSLRGSSNVRVLINNKPSTIIASSVADALKQIPADMIKSVEVITSPSAKYDAEGSAGIINIVTKKTTLRGATLNIDTGVGNRGANLGLQGSYRTGKMGFNLGGFGRANYNVIGKGESLQQSLPGAETQFSTRQMTDSKNYGAFGHYSLGWDYELSKTSSLAAGVRYGARNQISTQDITTIKTLGAAAATTTYRDVDVKDLSGTVDLNVDYNKSFKKPQQELSILSQFSRNNRTNNFDADNFSSNDVLKELLSQDGNDNKSYNQESTIQADFQTPFKNNQLLEVGAKGIFRQVHSNISYYGPSAQPDNKLDYDQNVAASYLSYTYTTKSKFTFKVGGRYEYTYIDAQQAETKLSIPAYSNFVPSINLSKTLKAGNTIKLAYNRRLQRPGIQFLNPNVNASNPQNISFGNPNLDPELTDQVELSTSFFKKSLYIGVSTFARFTNNSIESIRTTDETGVITTTYGNIGHKENYGLNIFGNLTLFSKWQLGGGFDAYYSDLTNNSPDVTLRASNSGFVLSGRFNTSLSIKNGWGLQGFGFMRGRDVQLQGKQSGFGIYSLGVKKDFKNKRGSVGLGMENFLSKTFKMRTDLTTSAFTQNSTNHLYNRGIRVNFSYRIGKMTFDDQPRRRRKSVSNDDVKSDGGSSDSK